MPDAKETIDILDHLRIGRGSSGKGGCWCCKADPTKTGPAFEKHTPTCERVAAFYEGLTEPTEPTQDLLQGGD